MPSLGRIKKAICKIMIISRYRSIRQTTLCKMGNVSKTCPQRASKPYEAQRALQERKVMQRPVRTSQRIICTNPEHITEDSSYPALALFSSLPLIKCFRLSVQHRFRDSFSIFLLTSSMLITLHRHFNTYHYFCNIVAA